MKPFKLGKYYKGINPDGTYILYKVVFMDKANNVANIKIIIDNDTRPQRNLERGMIVDVSIDTNLPSTHKNRWLTTPEEIVETSELLALIM